MRHKYINGTTPVHFISDKKLGAENFPGPRSWMVPCLMNTNAKRIQILFLSHNLIFEKDTITASLKSYFSLQNR